MPDTKIWLLEKKLQEPCLRYLTKSEILQKQFSFDFFVFFFIIQCGDRKSENLKWKRNERDITSLSLMSRPFFARSREGTGTYNFSSGEFENCQQSTL